MRRLGTSVAILGMAAVLAGCQNRGAIEAGRQVDVLLRKFIAETDVPGLSVAVAMGEEVVYDGSFGVSDIENGVPATKDTRYRIGSVTKLLTAAATAGFIEKGVVAADGRLQTYIPNLPDAYRDVTIAHLAGHTAGVRHYTREEAIGVNTLEYADLEDTLGVFINDPLLAPPGERYRYSSFGYVLLGAALENASGKGFADVIRDHVLDPAGMSDTLPETGEGAGASRTRFYVRTAEGGFAAAPGENFSYKRPAAGWLSTAADLARFGGALLSGKIVGPDILPLLLSSRRTNNGAETGCGFGFRIDTDSRGRKVVHHGGETPGARAFLLIYPEERVTIALAANVFRAPLFEGEAETIAGYFLGDYASTDRLVPPGEYAYAAATKETTVEGAFALADGRGVIADFPGGAVSITDIVRDRNTIRLIGVSKSGVVNIWLSQSEEGYTGQWGYDKPRTGFRMRAGTRDQ